MTENGSPVDTPRTDARLGRGAKRSAELASNLALLRGQIAETATTVGRDPADITLIVVTKTWPVEDIRRLAQLGVTDVGENRDQEARVKHEACAGLALRWHFIGGLQRNKCASVARYADLVHSVDRIKLVNPLDRAAQEADRDLRVLIQVSLDPVSSTCSEADGSPGAGDGGPARRRGVRTEELAALVDRLAGARRLRVAGVMGVAPVGGDARAAFKRLRETSATVRETWPEAGLISAGMSGDWRQAIEEGATHLRLGSAVLGARPPLG